MAYIILEEEQEDDEYEYGDACREEPEGFPLSKTGSTGVGDMAAKYASTLEGFNSEIRRERAVELSYEGMRFNDLRRWLLLTEYPFQ